MSLYPSLEDMKVDQMTKAQLQVIHQEYVPPRTYEFADVPSSNNIASVYPSLGTYMGLELSEDIIRENMPEYVHQNVSLYEQSSSTLMPVIGNLVAPISSQTTGLQKAQISNGIREIILCKDKDNKVGLRVKDINKGIFVSLVVENSPAALVGLRFGDQILQLNGSNVAGFSVDKVHEIIKKSPVNGIRITVRDRPFERTITLHKDSTANLGFQYKNGKIIAIVKDSSAARNGVLTDHQLLEIDGQNVVGLKDKRIREIIETSPNVVTITVIPSYVYEHMIKKMSGTLVKELMDHSVPTL
ncbi:syntenin-1-like [Euwallacea fornicatus]|uniref:syntenin-1-like n=1 Tax=Euwallacea fornicatus TaxID=995702 RepID=UPI00338D4A83